VKLRIQPAHSIACPICPAGAGQPCQPSHGRYWYYDYVHKARELMFGYHIAPEKGVVVITLTLGEEPTPALVTDIAAVKMVLGKHGLVGVEPAFIVPPEYGAESA